MSSSPLPMSCPPWLTICLSVPKKTSPSLYRLVVPTSERELKSLTSCRRESRPFLKSKTHHSTPGFSLDLTSMIPHIHNSILVDFLDESDFSSMCVGLTSSLIKKHSSSSNHIVISASDDRYRHLSSEAGPQEVQRSRMPKLKAATGSMFT